MQTIKAYWRPVLAALPLPMLALAASYGVYSFALLFVPAWVALAQAAAFETTYLGLAIVRTLDARQRQRASLISVGAVLTSIIYNTLAGWFHRQPELLTAADPLGWLFLAALHGAPLAWVAYLVSDLLLHQEPAVVRADGEVTRQTEAPAPQAPADSLPARTVPKTYHCKRCGMGPMDFGELGRHARKCDGSPVTSAAD